jgi:hypothetical protein
LRQKGIQARQACRAGHVEIEQDQVDVRVGLERIDGFGQRGCFQDLGARIDLKQRQLEPLPNQMMIIGHQEPEVGVSLDVLRFGGGDRRALERPLFRDHAVGHTRCRSGNIIGLRLACHG